MRNTIHTCLALLVLFEALLGGLVHGDLASTKMLSAKSLVCNTLESASYTISCTLALMADQSSKTVKGMFSLTQ